MELLLYFALVAIGFVLLIKGADFLVNGASSLAKRFNVSDMAIGLTVVAMGTSAPELVINIISGGVTNVETGTQDIVFANIIGSNIFNLFMILGLCAVIYPLAVHKDALWKEIPFSLVSSFVFYVLINDVLFFGKSHNSLSVVDSVVLAGMFILFLIYIFMNLSRDGSDPQRVKDIQVYGSIRTTLMICLGVAGLVFGGHMIVENAVLIARAFGVGEKMIGLTILAAGTALPELATATVAAFQRKPDLAVGNIVGSNIFNMLFILSVTGFIHGELAFNPVLNTDIYLMIIGTFMLFIFMFTFSKYRVDRIEGMIYLITFVGYWYFLFEREGFGWGLFF